MENIKRKRCENWCEDDKKLLQELIKCKVKVIENKNTDTNSNHLKKKGWKDIEQSFNEMCTGGERNITQLKTQWVAIKVQARKEAASYRKEVFKTGGGSQPPELPMSSNHINVWLPNEFIIDSNEFDCDALVEEVLDDDTAENDEEMAINFNEHIATADFEVQAPDNPKMTEMKAKVNSQRKEKINKKSSTEGSIEKITAFDLKCRQELHELQLEVERKKLRNLDKEYESQVEIEKKKKRNLDKEFDLTISKLMYFQKKVSGK